MDKRNNQSGSFDPKNSQQANDPLSQLNQFQRSIQPNQSRNHNQERIGQEKKIQQQNSLQAWTNQLKDWWSKRDELPIVERLKENPKLLKVAGGIIVCLLLLIIVSQFLGSTDVIQDFEKAVLEGDKDTLEDLLVSDHSDLEIDDVFLTRLIQHGQEDDDFLSSLVLRMNEQKNAYENGLETSGVFQKGSIYLKENDRFFGPDYVIGVRPTYIKIKSSEPPDKVTLDGKPYSLKKDSDGQLIGPILPGKYKVIASKKYPFAEVTDDEEVNLFEGDTKETAEFRLKGRHIVFTSSLEGTEIVVNNRATGTKVGEAGERFGPLSTNGSLTVYGQYRFPWGVVKSEPVKVQKQFGINITPNPFTHEETKKEVVQTINKYATEYVEVQEKKDGNLFTTLDEEQKKSWINDMNEKKEISTYYKGKAIKTLIAVKEGSITKEDDADVYKIQVPVQFHRKERTYARFEKGDEPLKEETHNVYITLTYNNSNKKWEISDFSPIIFGDNLFKDSSVIVTNH